MPPNSSTRITLLARLAASGETDQGAWDEFVRHYGTRIIRWCERWGLQEADVEDVSQQVLLKLSRRMRTFEYDPSQSFRAWLKTVTRNALLDFESDRASSPITDAAETLLTAAARTDLESQLEEEFDRELLEEALRRVKARVAPHTWDAFRLTALEQLDAANVAAQLSMSLGAVYQARSSVVKRLQEEREQLENSSG
jgi:RNA polymerase sigma factor (sigma-70 family)